MWKRITDRFIPFAKDKLVLLITVFILVSLFLSAFTVTSVISELTARAAAPPAALTVDAKASILMEPVTGKVLYENNADERLAPASVTKVMTMLLIYEALANGGIKYDDVVTVSERAASMGGSQIYLEPYEKQTVRDLLKSIVIASANDAAVAMAEYIGGSEESFVDMMNKKAAELGCKNTHFMNACGLDEDGHYTSARDMALIARELITKYPDVFNYTTVWQDTIVHKTKRGDEEFGLTNTNKLIKWYSGATGLKTGSTSKALFCLVGTAQRDGLSLIAVVFGSPTPAARFQETMKELDYGYANFRAANGLDPGAEVGTVKIEKGAVEEAKATVKTKVAMVVPKSNSGELKSVVNIAPSVDAPVKAGDKVGEIIYASGDIEVGRSDIIINEDIGKAPFSMIVKRLTGIWFN